MSRRPHGRTFCFVRADLKPEDIFIHREESGLIVKILDFGLRQNTAQEIKSRPPTEHAIRGASIQQRPERADVLAAGSVTIPEWEGDCWIRLYNAQWELLRKGARMKRLIQTLGPSVMLLLAGCGIETDAPLSCVNRGKEGVCLDIKTDAPLSCDHRTKKGVCLDYEEYPSYLGDRIKDDCTQQGGTFMTSFCPRTGVIGGCRASDKGLLITSWSYAGTTAAMIMQSCSAVGGTFVSQ